MQAAPPPIPAVPFLKRILRALVRDVKDRIWGYDFFISYHWASGGAYAVNLAQRLRARNFDVFLDRTDYASGDDWKAVGEIALRNTQRLVIVATREAVTISLPVEHEVKIFTGRNRQVVSIVFGDKFADLDRSQFPTLNRMPDSKLFIDELPELLASSPSDRVVDELVRTYGVMRRRSLRALLMLTPGIAVAVFAVFAFASWCATSLAMKEAKKLAEEEAIARGIAEDRGNLADARRLAAQGQVEAARDSFQNAVLFSQEALERYPTDSTVHQTARDILAEVNARFLTSGTSPARQLAFDPTSRFLVGFDTDANGIVWDLTKREAFPRTKTFPTLPDQRHLFADRPRGPLPLSLFGVSDLNSLSRLYLSANGKYLASWTNGGQKAAVWKLEDAEAVQHGPAMQIEGDAGSAAVTSDGMCVIVLKKDRSLESWRLDSARQHFTVTPATKAAYSSNGRLLISPDDKWVHCGMELFQRGDDGGLKPVDIGQRPDDSGNENAVFSSDGRYIFMYGPYGITGLQLRSESPPRSLQFHGGEFNIKGWVDSIDVTPDGQLLVAGFSDGTIQAWTIVDEIYCNELGRFAGHSQSVKQIQISPIGQRMVSVSKDGTARCWDLSARSPQLSVWSLHSLDQVEGAVLDSTGRWLAASGRDSMVVPLWDLNDGYPAKSAITFLETPQDDDLRIATALIPGYFADDAPGTASRIVISSDRKWMADFTSPDGCRIVDLRACNQRDCARAIAAPGGVDRPIFSSDNLWIGLRHADQFHVYHLDNLSLLTSVKLLDLNRESEPRHTESPDIERKISKAGLTWECVVDNSNREGPAVVMKWKNNREQPIRFTYRNFDVTLRTSVLDSGDPGDWSRDLQETDHSITSVDVTSDGRWAVAGDHDGNVLVWSVTSNPPWRNPIKLRGHSGPVRDVQVSVDGKWICTQGTDKTVRVWPLDTATLLNWMRQVRGGDAP